MRLNDLKEDPLLGNYGAAALQGLAGDKASMKDRMAKNIFLRDMVGKLQADIESGIHGQLIDPNPVVAQPAPIPSGAEQIRKAKQQAAANVAQQQMAANPVPQKPAQPTPGQVRQQKQTTAASAAQQQMATNPAPQKPVPQTPAQIRQQKQAAAAATAQKQMAAEGRYNKLNAIFESIMSEENGQFAYTISSYLQNAFKKYMRGVDVSNPQVQAKVKALADEVQTTWAKDKGTAAITKLANLGYALSGMGADEKTVAGKAATSQGVAIPTSMGNAMLAGLKQGLSNKTPGNVQATSSVEEPETTEPSAFGQMARQLGDRPTTSSTGGTTTGVSGVVRHKAGRGNKVKQAQAAQRNQRRQVAPAKRVASPVVAESKQYKVWGEK